MLSYPKSESQPATLLSLPAEIRLRIYDFLMVPIVDGERDENMFHTSDPLFNSPIPLRFTHKFPTALMRTCHLIHAETSHYYYSRVTRRLSYNSSYTPEQLWPCNDWSYRRLGLLNIELAIQPCEDDEIGEARQNFVRYFCEEFRDTKINCLAIHHQICFGHSRMGTQRYDYSYLAGLGSLVGSVNTVVIGCLFHRLDDDENAYRAIKDALCGVPNWGFVFDDDDEDDYT